jgi:glycosyltransferase involved in cell wall biosynthesis
MTEVFLGQPDIFFSTVNRTPVARGIPIVSLAYDLIALRFPDLYGHIDPLLPERLRKTVERSAAIIAISECTKRDYVEILGADPNLIHVVYPGVESSFRAQLDEPARDTILRKYGLRQPYLLYVGTLAPHKNVETLVRVYKRLKERYNIPHYLVLCGQAQWGQKVVEAAKDLIAVRDCVVLDFIPSKDLPYVYHGAEAFVFLSLYEGFGLPPLEAMTCGIPVVASSASSLPEVVGDAGILVDPTDEGAIETELYRVLTDESLRQKMQAQGFQQAAHFSWSEAAEKILKVFNAVRCPR